MTNYETLKADITMMDGTILNQVMLFKSKNMGDSQIVIRTEAEEYLNDNKTVFFGGMHVQGWLIPEQISHYKLYDINVEKNVKEFVKNNGGIYDTNDTADFIIDYREELLKLLK